MNGIRHDASALKRIRIMHRLRVALALLGFGVLVAAVGTLWWANHTGLPEAWRERIERTLANQNFHTDIQSLRYSPMRGIIAEKVTFYTDDSRSRSLAELNELVLDVDPSRLSRGEVSLDRIDLTGAQVSIAADPETPESGSLDFTGVQGSILLGNDRHLEVQNASGMIGGVKLELGAVIQRYRQGVDQSPADATAARAQRRKILTDIIDALEAWGPRGDKPPLIRMQVLGDLEEPQTLRGTLDINGSGFHSKDLEVQSLDFRSELRGTRLVVHQLDILTPTGRLTGSVDFDPTRRDGHFDVRSNLDLVGLFQSIDVPLPDGLPTLGQPPLIEAHGSVNRTDGQWNLTLMGQAELNDFTFRQIKAESLSADFSWKDGKLFLEDLLLRNDGHQLNGRIFITPEKILYQASTDLPIPFVQNAVTIQPLGRILDDFSASEKTAISAEFEGHITPGERRNWSFKGTVEGSALAFRDVPAKRARVDLDLTSSKMDFSNGEIEFDYRDYPLRKAHGGPLTGHATVDLIQYDRNESVVNIRNLKGEAWPAPIVRTFATKIADQIENYGFHSNPGLVANGVIGIKDGRPKQDLTVRFGTQHPADYDFLGTTLRLDSPRGIVRVLPDTVQVNDLRLGLFGGLLRGALEFPMGAKSIEGELDWTSLSLPALCRAFDFKSQPKGRLTGRLDFNLTHRDVGGLNGDGHVALEGGELFQVPVFGPLSPVISTVLGNRKAGFQEASDAFCTFDIRKGIFSTLDFSTQTSSLVFTGDAMVDLAKKTMQMTVRMNARGLLGVLTLPLRPFYGMFQFRGTGPIEKPEWDNAMFTSPPEAQKKTLLEPPKARAVPQR